MPGETGLLQVALFLFTVVIALGLGYLAIFFRLQPVFLLTLAIGLLLGNLPSQELAGALAPFLATLQSGLYSGLYPALIFLGWGAGANLGTLVSHPRQVVLGILPFLAFLVIICAGWLFGLTPQQSGSIALIGGGDGLSATFLASQIAPELTGPVSLAAFTLVGLQLLLHPFLLRALTTRQERVLRMAPARNVSRRENLLFATAGLILTLLVIPRAALLTGMFFLGVILKESGVADRLSRTLANRLGEIAAVLLGLAVGSLCQASTLFSLTFLLVVALGLAALVLANLTVVLAIKLINLVSAEKINPLVGAAALGLVPDAAHMVQVYCRQEDPHCNIYPHALASCQAALITASLTAGLLWGILGGR
jgi:sodium ion-translocating decarboxylase beta subunit